MDAVPHYMRGADLTGRNSRRVQGNAPYVTIPHRNLNYGMCIFFKIEIANQ